MKIIVVDNFDRELRSDRLVAENIANKDYAKVMTEALNAAFSGSTAPDYFRAVPDEHKLFTAEV